MKTATKKIPLAQKNSSCKPRDPTGFKKSNTLGSPLEPPRGGLLHKTQYPVTFDFVSSPVRLFTLVAQLLPSNQTPKSDFVPSWLTPASTQQPGLVPTLYPVGSPSYYPVTRAQVRIFTLVAHPSFYPVTRHLSPSLWLH